MSVVIDTNVLAVANGRHAPASDACVGACIDALLAAREQGVSIDDGLRVLDEYRQHASFAGQPGVGDAFFKWLWDHQADALCCERVVINPHPGRGFIEFPGDQALRGFDASDRKFVAVALTSASQPPVLNASDTDWWEFRTALEAHGLQIQFLCPDLMAGNQGRPPARKRRR